MEPDNVVRFIDAFVDGLDLKAAGFRLDQAKTIGRPEYDPADLLKLYICGYLNRVRSSRRWTVGTRRSLEVIWLLRRLTPDVKTIADFRRNNRTAFRQVFREFVVLCRELDVFGRELIAVDGTRINAVNSRERNFTKAKLAKAMAESDERLARYLKQLDETNKDGEDAPESGTVERLQEKIAALRKRRERFDDHGKALADSGADQISLTDPDARAMHSGSRVGVGCNIQIAVETRHKLIVEQQVHDKVSDLGLLTETAKAAREALVGRGSAVAPGFFPRTSSAMADACTCPGAAALRRMRSRPVRGEIRVFDHANAAACTSCVLKARCTAAACRKSTRDESEAVLDRMAQRPAARPGVRDERRESVGHPLGCVKHGRGQGAFLMRGRENVRAEFTLTAIADNLRRAISPVGIPALLAAGRP